MQNKQSKIFLSLVLQLFLGGYSGQANRFNILRFFMVPLT